jgi:hypothetical protein
MWCQLGFARFRSPQERSLRRDRCPLAEARGVAVSVGGGLVTVASKHEIKRSALLYE